MHSSWICGALHANACVSSVHTFQMSRIADEASHSSHHCNRHKRQAWQQVSSRQIQQKEIHSKRPKESRTMHWRRTHRYLLDPVHHPEITQPQQVEDDSNGLWLRLAQSCGVDVSVRSVHVPKSEQCCLPFTPLRQRYNHWQLLHPTWQSPACHVTTRHRIARRQADSQVLPCISPVKRFVKYGLAVMSTSRCV